MIIFIPQKVCRQCNEMLIVGEFSPDKRSRDGFTSHCKNCHKLYYFKRREYYMGENARWQQENKESKSHYQRKYLYGLTLEAYNKMLVDQKYTCFICLQPESTSIGNMIKNLSVDHDHDTGKVRSLLCNRCNVGIGRLENVGRDCAMKFIEYLDFFGGWSESSLDAT